MRAARTVTAMTEQRRMFRTRWVIAAATALVLAAAALTAVVVLLRHGSDGGVGQLAKRDQRGAAACQTLRAWTLGQLTDPHTGQPQNMVVVSVAAGADAAQSSTDAIRATAGQPLLDGQAAAIVGMGGTMRAANLSQLRAACLAAGVQIRPLPS